MTGVHWIIVSIPTTAQIYIDRKIADLGTRPGVLAIHAVEGCRSVAESLKAHAMRRIDRDYPEKDHGGETGALLPGLQQLLQEEAKRSKSDRQESAFDMKQSTTHDASNSSKHIFDGMRPSIVVDEAETRDTFPPEVVAEHALDNVLDMTVRMSNVFEDQFVSKYLPRVFPWALNYDCGGAEYPKLFENWTEVLDMRANKNNVPAFVMVPS